MLKLEAKLQDLESIAQRIVQEAGMECIWVFRGPMGSGKTTLIKSICKALGVEDNVSSPTFSLVNEYSSASGPIYHFDFYRINSIEEVYDLGYEDYFFSGSICMLEWAERITELLPEHYFEIQISGDEAFRKYELNLI
jgi:tRNA threonylcarbamoyladenosine biosynthesis protein TsaE